MMRLQGWKDEALAKTLWCISFFDLHIWPLCSSFGFPGSILPQQGADPMSESELGGGGFTMPDRLVAERPQRTNRTAKTNAFQLKRDKICDKSSLP